jgi:hypothetical protein
VVLTFLGFDTVQEVGVLKSINSVRFLGFVCDRLVAYFSKNFCIFPLNLEGELAVIPIKFIENLFANVCLYF